MSNGSLDNDYLNRLAAALNKAQSPTPPPVRLRVMSKKTKHSERLAERVAKNAELVDRLIDVIKEVNRQPGTENEVDKLIDIAKDLLENNAKLREQVGEAIQDIPNA